MFHRSLYFCLQFLIYWSKFIYSNAEPLVGKKIGVATDHEFSFIVSIGLKSVNGRPGHYHYCTGALISRQHVLTAEHCFEDTKLSDIQVSVGSADNQAGQRYEVDFLTTFESWAQQNKKQIKYSDNDVAIIILAKEVDDPRVRPAIPTYKQSRDLYDKDAVTAGWGVSNTGHIPRRMEKANLHIISYVDCMEHVKEIVGRRIIISENFLCTLTNEDALIQSGDSGAPLFIGNEIIAINGATFPEDRPDNDPNVQNMHVQLYYYKDFIEDSLHSEYTHL